ncbi:MAG: hypothetical protein M1376_23555 [Planctomycetes bacterium]|nr:hypothetical protein [Planctomycetota bacterium]
MSPLVSILIVLAGLTGASSGVAGRAQSPQPANVPLSVAPVAGSTISISGDVVGDPFLPEQTQENVLVVPTPDLPVESLTDLTEDLSVMCRIFDKSVPATGSGGFAYGTQGDSLRWVIGQQSRGTQGLYLDGYGALFFLRVDYPLAPTQKEDAGQAKPKESGDSVWSQTVREMNGQPGDESQSARNAPAYDAQKVENLKKTLVKTLAHASNIRMRRPQDVITLVVGALDDARVSGYGRFRSAGWGTARTSPVRPGTAQPPAAIRNPATAMLILRITKADVDALAKGQLTSAQFTEKVQILWSSFEQGTPETRPARIGVSTGSNTAGTKR